MPGPKAPSGRSSGRATSPRAAPSFVSVTIRGTEMAMTNADRLQRWNHWYERTPETWRFQIVVWTLVIVGAVNMLLTIAIGFPFALLVGIAMVAIACVRVPYVLGWVRTDGEAAADARGARLEVEAPSWVLRLNRWYDGLDEMQRALALLTALAIPGALNMLLTMAGGFPFGLLFLLAVLAIIAIRAPYTAGWYTEPSEAGTPALSVAPQAPRIGDESANAPFAATPPRAAEGAPLSGEAQPPGPRSPSASATPAAEPPR